MMMYLMFLVFILNCDVKLELTLNQDMNYKIMFR